MNELINTEVGEVLMVKQDVPHPSVLLFCSVEDLSCQRLQIWMRLHQQV